MYGAGQAVFGIILLWYLILIATQAALLLITKWAANKESIIFHNIIVVSFSLSTACIAIAAIITLIILFHGGSITLYGIIIFVICALIYSYNYKSLISSNKKFKRDAKQHAPLN